MELFGFMVQKRFELCRKAVSSSEPNVLEGLVRGLLIHYFFHISDKGRLEIFDVEPGAARTINVLTPTVFRGAGRIRLAPRTVFGVPRSPGNHSCSYVESRTPDSLIEIGDGTVINNSAFLLSEGASIRIGRRGLFGPELQIMDSNSHQLVLGRRSLPDDDPRPVVIGDDVFIGARVTILKGARIGDGCIISAGCVVPPSFVAPPLSVIVGNPARVIGKVPESSS
ncbi:MAG: hypothetical protein A2486_05125 [Burkholderiales bacterium RIFOXYC12_FULL_65_23]|uniref:acyltransferase n=1 Tax=Malikia spinosa TaxID=86180 RepID=UPI0008B8A52D|nr:acyltransferase [Malikia spinosa]OGB69866.1 MAG: hypothetical protein A2486_05125 [Burkholderiales bacterium RIFOXYC12_FULL_65_23]